MSPLVESLSAALAHFLWQGCVIALALALLLRLTRSASANLRYALCVTALGLMVLMPVGTVLFALGGAGAGARTSTETPEAAPVPGPLRSPAGSLPQPGSPGRVTLEGLLQSGSLRSGIVTLWLIGVFAFTAINTEGWLRLRELRRSGVPVDDPCWAPWIAELRGRLGIGRWVAVLGSTRVDVPTVIGWIRPVVLVPTSALLGLPPRLLEALLLHELAHVRRHDFLVNLLQAAVETLLFYHPAVWWVSRRARCEREHCCDDVAISRCGRRQDYLEALADMERLRLATPSMAVAADGGSLVERIRRLTGSNRQQNDRGARWVLGLGIIALVLTIGAVQLVALPSANARPASSSASPTTLVSLAPAMSGESEAIEGTWRARLRRGEVWLELRLDGRRNHRSSFSLVASELTGTGEDGIPGFQLRRDAGTFFFEGKLDGSDRESRYEFRPDPDYVDRMRSIGFDVPASARRLYELAAVDVSLEFAAGIRDAGYGDISVGKLTEFRIHGVTPMFVAAMADTGFEGLSASRLVEFRIHGVSPDFVQEMADSGLEGLSASRLVEFRIHGVSAEFVRAMASSGLEELSPQRLIEFRIHGVTPDFVTGMADVGLGEVSANRLVEFRIHGVTPAFVRALQDTGLEELSPSRLVEFRIHGVSAEFVEELAALGLADVSASSLVEMRIHGVTPDFVRAAQSRYGEDLTARELIEMRIHGRSHEYDAD